jgi:subtilisin-like proprotein convertase family protein
LRYFGSQKVLKGARAVLTTRDRMEWRRNSFVLIALLLLVLATSVCEQCLRRPPTRYASAVETGALVGVYWDKNCTQATSSIEWGTLTLAETRRFTVYARNEGNETLLLAVTVSNWTPSDAPAYINFSWSCQDATIKPKETEKVELALTVATSIDQSLHPAYSNFGFKMTFEGIVSGWADIYIQHTWVGDLIVTIGVENSGGPSWQKVLWNRQGGGQHDLRLNTVLSDVAAYLPPSQSYRWFLKVYDAASKDQGSVTGFSITYNGYTYVSNDVPVPILDLKTSYAYLPPNPPPSASAKIYIEHTWVGDLNITLGCGNPSSPLWSKLVWNRAGGSQKNLSLTVDLSSALAYLPPSDTYRWYLKVYDAAAGDTGRIVTFNISYQGKTYSSTNVLVPIKDFLTSYAYIPSPIPPQVHMYIQHTYRGDLIVDFGVGSTSSPLWSRRVWNGTGGSADNLDLYVDISSAVVYLPPSATYTWWVKIYDRATGDTGKITTFTITYQGKTYTSPNVPVPIYDLKTSYAYIKG